MSVIGVWWWHCQRSPCSPSERLQASAWPHEWLCLVLETASSSFLSLCLETHIIAAHFQTQTLAGVQSFFTDVFKHKELHLTKVECCLLWRRASEGSLWMPGYMPLRLCWIPSVHCNHHHTFHQGMAGMWGQLSIPLYILFCVLQVKGECWICLWK